MGYAQSRPPRHGPSPPHAERPSGFRMPLWSGKDPSRRPASRPRHGSARYRLMGEAHAGQPHRAAADGPYARRSGRDAADAAGARQRSRRAGRNGATPAFQRSRFGDPAPDEPEIARPLLDVLKARLRATLQARGIAWIEDPSNQSPEFERPRLRAARAHLDDLGLTDAMLALSATRLLRARRALDRAVDEFCSSGAGAVSVDPLRIRHDRSGPIAGGRGGNRAAGSGPRHCRSRRQRRTGLARQARSRLRHRCSARRPGTTKWTLARAMITANDQTVTIEREPGREPLPRLELSAGAQACWDGRFWVSVGADVETGAIVEVRPLGEAAARELQQQGAVTTRAPVRAAGLVPSFWRGDRLLAVPSLEFWSDPNCREHSASTIYLERNREQLQALRARQKPRNGCSNSGRPENSPSLYAQNAPSGLKLGKDLLHYLCYGPRRSHA